MNIMFVVGSPVIPHVGGLERVTAVLSKELLCRNHRIIFLCYDKSEYIEYDSYIAPQLYVDVKNQVDESLQESLAKIVEKYSIDRVICQVFNSYNARIISNLPNQLRYKVVTCSHLMPFESDRLTRKRLLLSPHRNLRQIVFKVASLLIPAIARNFFNNCEKRNFKSCFTLTTKACFLSEKFFPIIQKHMPDAPIEKFIAIGNPNSFRTQDFVPKEQERENALLWVGRIENAQKNISGFLKMWIHFSKSHPDWKAFVVGTGTDLNKYLEESKKGKWNNLTFEGAQSDVAKYYKKCKYFCMTSFGESWGMVITEAMTFGCVPVAMNTFPTLTDIIDNGKNGLICDSNPISMANTLNSTIASPIEWGILSAGAVEKVKEFDVSLVADKWEELLNNL